MSKNLIFKTIISSLLVGIALFAIITQVYAEESYDRNIYGALTWNGTSVAPMVDIIADYGFEQKTKLNVFGNKVSLYNSLQDGSIWTYPARHPWKTLIGVAVIGGGVAWYEDDRKKDSEEEDAAAAAAAQQNCAPGQVYLSDGPSGPGCY